MFTGEAVRAMADMDAPQSVGGQSAGGGDLASADAATLSSVRALLRRRGFADAEAALARELVAGAKADGECSASNAASIHISDGSAANYRVEYRALIRFVHNVSDRYKAELRSVLYPMFANIYLELVANRQYEAARDLYTEFAPVQLDYWQHFVRLLNFVTTADHIDDCAYATCLRTGIFMMRVSKQSFNELKAFLLRHSLLQDVMRRRMFIDTLDGPPRSEAAVTAICGNPLGEATNKVNKQKVLYGLLRDDGLAEEGGKRSATGGKKQSKQEKQSKKAKDPAAPQQGRIPLPDVSDVVRAERRQRQRDAARREPINASSPPYVLMYTVINACGGVTSMSFSDDCQWLATGGADSSLNVWTLTERMLLPLKLPDELAKLDTESDTIASEMLDAAKPQSVRTLRAHSAPVHGASFSCDKRLLLSCSADSTVRLWSTQLWHNLVVYQLGAYPIWDVQFSPRGFYFATGSSDNVASLWCTERVHPLRMFAGHTAPVRTVRFHPNSNYVIAADAHRDVRMYDALSGQCARMFPGMKSSVSDVCVSPDGRLVAACSDTAAGSLCVWDIASGKQLVACSNYARLHSVSFAKADSSVLLCGGVQHCVKVLGVDQLVQQAADDGEPKMDGPSLELYDFATRRSPVLAVTTSARNVVLAAGVFDQ